MVFYMPLVRPRINDYHGLAFTQEEVDFAVPFLDEDLPLCLDPFLLWKSPSLQDNSLHTAITNSFNQLGYLIRKGRKKEAIDILIRASECAEVGLGNSATRKGTRIGQGTAEDILFLFEHIPQINKAGFVHFEEIQLYVEHISRDRISDIACNFMMSFLVDYTIQNSSQYRIPTVDIPELGIYDYKKHNFVEEKNIRLPVNPENGQPVLLVPKRWLRALPWINYDDYFDNYFQVEVKKSDTPTERIKILEYNRRNYDVVSAYIRSKERTQEDCKNDPLFKPIPITSAKRQMAAIKTLPRGKTDNADKKYEDAVFKLMASLLYPQMDFATDQARTESGVLIRDLIFYNNKSYDFLEEIYNVYGSRQIVMELKNVKEVEREHIQQLNRYLNDTFGKFGILITRNKLPKAIFKNSIDLWSGQRRCIIALADEDLDMMVDLFESKQRLPIDVIKKKYIEFTRACPS